LLNKVNFFDTFDHIGRQQDLVWQIFRHSEAHF